MRFLRVVPILLFLVSCNSPTDPTHGPSQLSMLCMPAGANVQCSATAYNVDGIAARDVTRDATWLLSNPAAGSFAQPGLFVPSSHGEVALWVRYKTLEYTVKQSFLVGSGEPARWLYWLSGVVKDAATGERLAGATVQILDGYAAGKSSTTNENGVYRIEPVLTGETFTAVASKPGYTSTTLTYRVDPPAGPPGNPAFLDFALRK